jgi:hypothetical protein
MSESLKYVNGLGYHSYQAPYVTLPSLAMVISIPVWTTCASGFPVSSRPSSPIQAETALASFPERPGALTTINVLELAGMYYFNNNLRDKDCD